jgi:queuine tRNA-ribosyltransferase
MEFFKLEDLEGEARSGIIRTKHGSIETPVFMPVATQGSVKALDSADLNGLGASILLSNTYHLYLRPGVETITNLGGLHRMMNWDNPILTDSGGFQGFSLEHLRKIEEDGIRFKSHIDGSQHILTPESVMDIQKSLGSDIVMPLDVCSPADSDFNAVQSGLELTNRWMDRTLGSLNGDQRLFGIVQGGLFTDLRERSAEYLVGLNLPGYSIGGLSVGESKPVMYDTISSTTKFLPKNKPRYLMGVGSPEDLVESVFRGIDMFDCVLPTRVARKGAVYTLEGRINITGAKYTALDQKIEETCDCYACENYSVGYLKHLFKSKEYLAYRLASIHNLRFIVRLMGDIRRAIQSGKFAGFRDAFLSNYRSADHSVKVGQAKRLTRKG